MRSLSQEHMLLGMEVYADENFCKTQVTLK